MSDIHKSEYGQYQNTLYMESLEGRKPQFTSDWRRWEQEAKDYLPATSWSYIYGGAGISATLRDNVAAFDHWKILPRMLRGNTTRDTSVELFGKRYACPMLMAPVGVNDIVSPAQLKM